MRRKPQQARSAFMVDNIVQAAMVCAVKQGIHQTTTHHIAEVAGVSVGNLYHYFEDKDAIFEEVHRRQFDEVVAFLHEITPLVLAQMDIRQAIGLVLSRFVEFLRANDGRQLNFVNQLGGVRSTEHVKRIEHELLFLALQYATHNPRVLAIKALPTVIYVVINSGVMTIVNFLNDPRKDITIEQVLEGLSTMVAAYIDVQTSPVQTVDTPKASRHSSKT